MVVSESNSEVNSAMDLNKSRGFSDKWVLELDDGKRVVVPMEIERQLFRGSVLDEFNAMDYSGNSSRPLEVQSEWDRVLVEDVDFESLSKKGGEMVEFDRRGSDISEPLNVILLAISKYVFFYK